MAYTFQQEIGGRTLTLETGGFAEQANGAVTVHYGDTVVLVTACVSSEPREGIDFFPLTVDYEERFYAAGKIPGGFFRREGRPSEDAILAGRLTDRPLRPLFPQNFRNEVQIVITVLSTDQENDPDILSIIGASAAVGISEAPFARPVGAVRVGCLNGEFVLNPTFTQLTQSDFDLVVAGTKDGIIMLEAGAKEAPEDVIFEAIKFGEESIKKIIELQDEIIKTCGKPKMSLDDRSFVPELEEPAISIINERFSQDEGILLKDKAERGKIMGELEGKLLEKFSETFSPREITSTFEAKFKERVRASISEKDVRLDGRKLDEVRPISCEVGRLPRTHGSGLFTRGMTQVLTIATLGSLGEEQPIDGLGQEEHKRFMHHYNFPPFSVGEVGRLGSPRRREIGHGALAERALEPVIPDEEEFPYTVRLVSEVLSSNGSTSMASVCGSTLSLMDAGVPIKAPVAGVAMGLVSGENGKFAVLTDIEGLEDKFGDMDFKVAGTASGITAIQMDTKTKGITYEVVERALNQARSARLFILKRMKETIEKSRPELSKYAPRMFKMKIDPDKIRNVIGPGGKVIRSIIEETKATVDVSNDGTIIIGSPSEEGARKAISIIEGLTKDAEVGGIYAGKVTRIADFGAFVEILPGKEGLVHISELSDHRVARVEDVTKIGEEVTVMVTGIDNMGRINLSHRAVIEKLSQIQGVKKVTQKEPSRGNAKPFSRPRQNRAPKRF